MKRIKNMRTAACILLAVFLLASCGKTLELNPEKVVEQLQGQLTFTDQMASVKPDKACQIYGVDEALVENCAALRGSGATAENLSVWQAKDTDAAQELAEQLHAFLDSWIEGYSDYKPEEVPKLESAILTSEGKYIVLCVSADNESAETLISDILHP